MRRLNPAVFSTHLRPQLPLRIAAPVPAPPRPRKGHHYWSLAIRILRSLCGHHLAKKDKKWEGILKSGVYHLPKELGVDESVIWGEYFFVEALEQALPQLG